jgi:hypothetical protein
MVLVSFWQGAPNALASCLLLDAEADPESLVVRAEEEEVSGGHLS